MKTQYYTATSLDGFIATEDDSLDWLFPLGDLSDTGYPDFLAQVGALAMGSTTYEWILQHSESVAKETGSAWPYMQPAWVFTHRQLPRIEGADIRFVQGSVKAAHAEMMAAANGKNIWVVGGGDLAGQFHDAGLLDEAIIQLASVTLGRGKPIFPRRVTSPPWKLLSVRHMTLPSENVPLAECFNASKEYGHDEDGAGALHAGVQAGSRAAGDGWAEHRGGGQVAGRGGADAVQLGEG